MLEGAESHIPVKRLREREGAAESSAVLSDGECLQRLVEHFGFPYCPCSTEISGVAYDRICEDMVSEVLPALVCIASLGRRSVQEGETECVVRGLVPAVFAVIEH